MLKAEWRGEAKRGIGSLGSHYPGLRKHTTFPGAGKSADNSTWKPFEVEAVGSGNNASLKVLEVGVYNGAKRVEPLIVAAKKKISLVCL